MQQVKLNLRNFDLNLLVAFDVLMRECNVSRAAEAMFVSQSAMSHSLNRLRQLTDDPLLVRTSGGMKPTPRALALVEPVRKALQDIEQCIHAPLTFDPKLSHRRFVIAGNDYVEYLVVPPLVNQIQEHAPGIDLNVNQPDIVLPEEQIENGDIDLVLGFQVILRPPPYLRAETLFLDQMACMVRANHPLAGVWACSNRHPNLAATFISALTLNGHKSRLASKRGHLARRSLNAPPRLEALPTFRLFSRTSFALRLSTLSNDLLVS